MQDGRTKLGAVAVLFLVGTGWAGGSATNHYNLAKGVMNSINSSLHPPRSIELVSEGCVTDISLRGPTKGGTPENFVCDEAEVIGLINAHQHGEHLSTDEMVYVLRAYELDYRKQMENPQREGGYLRRSFYPAPSGPPLTRVDAQ